MQLSQCTYLGGGTKARICPITLADSKWRPVLWGAKRDGCLILNLIGTYLCGAKNGKKTCYRIFDSREMGVEVVEVTITWTIRAWRSSLYLRCWQTRTHCWGHIVAHNVSWARKRAGHKMNSLFPCCANWETFVADTKCFWTKSETFFVSRTQNLCPQQMLRARANGDTFVWATMCPPQCVLVCQGL